MSLDAGLLARRQRELDATAIPDATLRERKRTRMLASPLAFLRGSAPLFYEMLAAEPALADGPEASGWIAGDLHVENFGAYRPAAVHDENEDGHRAVFGINDFDDATVAPCRLDVLRLGASLLLGVRDLGLSGALRHELLRILVDAHADAIAGASRAPEPAPCVEALLSSVRGRTRKALLDARTELAGHARRFVRGPRYQDLRAETAAALPAAFAQYVASLPEDERPVAEALAIVDAAFRVAGTGSLGRLRVAVLTRGKGGADGGFIFDLKEQAAPSAAVLVPPPAMAPVTRVISAVRAMNSHPPRMLGETVLVGAPCLGRRLAPQEDRLDWAHVKKDELPQLVRHLGWITGRAHAQALAAPLPHAWSAPDRAALREGAIRLAGLHEAIYLAYLGEA